MTTASQMLSLSVRVWSLCIMLLLQLLFLLTGLLILCWFLLKFVSVEITQCSVLQSVLLYPHEKKKKMYCTVNLQRYSAVQYFFVVVCDQVMAGPGLLSEQHKVILDFFFYLNQTYQSSANEQMCQHISNEDAFGNHRNPFNLLNLSQSALIG